MGHDEGRALNTDASNAQTVSATESVPSRHRRQARDRRRGSGTPEHRREQRPNKQRESDTPNKQRVSDTSYVQRTYTKVRAAHKIPTIINIVSAYSHSSLIGTCIICRWGMHIPGETVMGHSSLRLPASQVLRSAECQPPWLPYTRQFVSLRENKQSRLYR